MQDVRYDRSLLLSEPKRNAVLTLGEVARYGRDSFGDPDYVSLYGLRPAEWYDRGVRIRGRTAVECTRDRLGELIGRDVGRVVHLAPYGRATVVDLFAGSANTLFWIQRHFPSCRAVGFELDRDVLRATRQNISLLELDLELHGVDYRTGLASLTLEEDELLVAFVAPPWGEALSSSGLDLGSTSPPVAEIVDALDASFPSPLLVAIQIYEQVDAASLSDVERRFEWSMSTAYAIDAPGTNHGLLLGSMRWTPEL